MSKRASAAVASSSRPRSSRRRSAIQARLDRVDAVGARLERRGGDGQRAWRAAQVAHGKCDFGLRDDAARPCNVLVRAEAARRTPQQLACARVLAELRHGDAAQRERRRVVAQRDALEGAECIAGDESTCRGGDQ